ncbi:MAG: ABC transporter permease [Firmicutes bacterium]|nr:ABC transporter permease [Bacillota bacterium]
MSEEHVRYLRRVQRERWTIIGLRAGFLVFLLLAWQAVVDLGWIDHFVVSSPREIWETAVRLARAHQLWIHVETTFLESVAGFTLGTLIGVVLATLLWWSPLFARVADPYLTVLQALPKIALGPVFLIWLQQYEAILAIALAISVVVSVMMVYTGFHQTDPDRIRLLRAFGASDAQIWRIVVLPGSLPTIMSALKMNVGMALTGVIVGEFLVGRQGVGYLIVYGGQVFQMSLVMTGVAILAAMAALMHWGVEWLERRFARWPS